MSSYRVRFHGSEIHAETVSRHQTAEEAVEAALDAARTASYGGVYYTAEERDEDGPWSVLARYTRERADREDEEDEGEDEGEEVEPPVGSFAGAVMDDVTVHEVHIHGGKAVAIVAPGYACDDDGPLAGPVVDARAHVRRCLPAGWDVDVSAEVRFSPVYQDAHGQPREDWTFALVRKDA